MITEHDLREAIAECEGQRSPTASTCMKLAAFYTILDKMYPAERERKPFSSSYSAAPAPPVPDGKIGAIGGTAFMRAISGMDMKDLIPVIDELMTTLETVSPRIYAGVMRRLSEMN